MSVENSLNEFCKTLKSKYRDYIYYFNGLEDFPCRNDSIFNNIKVYSLDRIKEAEKFKGKSFDSFIIFTEEILFIEYFHPYSTEFDDFIKEVLTKSKYSLDIIIEKIDEDLGKNKELLDPLKEEILSKIKNSKNLIKNNLYLKKYIGSFDKDLCSFYIIVDMRRNINIPFEKNLKDSIYKNLKDPIYLLKRKRNFKSATEKNIEKDKEYNTDFGIKNMISKYKTKILDINKRNIIMFLENSFKNLKNIHVGDCSSFVIYIRDLTEFIKCPKPEEQ